MSEKQDQAEKGPEAVQKPEVQRPQEQAAKPPETRTPEKPVSAQPKTLMPPKRMPPAKPAEKKHPAGHTPRGASKHPKGHRPSKEESKLILTAGKRKKAVARATFRPGKGRITLNTLPIDQVESEIMRLRLQEPLVIAGDAWKSWDISVNVKGGGTTGQVDAARMAIARGLVEVTGKGLREKYMALDRNLLVFDPRRTEPHKPPRSSQGPRRYKQRSKR